MIKKYYAESVSAAFSPMTQSYNNNLSALSEPPEQTLIDSKCSVLMKEIHRTLDLKNAPIKTIVQS